MASPTVPADRRRRAAAAVVSEVLSPWVLGFLVPVAVAAASTSTTRSLSLGVTVAVLTGLVPCVLVAQGARRGWWSDRSVPRREDRPRLVAVCAVPALVAGAGLLAARAPRPLELLVLAMVVGALVVGAVSRRWKVSLHAAVAGGSTAALVATAGPVALVGLPAVALVAWARVVLRAHTVAQVVVGAFIGLVVGGAVMALA